MIDRAPWQGHRVEGWSYDVLDLNDRVVGVLADVDEDSPGSISRSVYTSPRDTATLTLTRSAPWDWTQHRVRITHVLHTAAGEVRHPVLTGTVSAPVEDHTDEAVQIALELSDKTGLLAGDQPSGAYGLAAGTSVSGAVRALIASEGDTGTLIGGSVEALALPMMWDAGTRTFSSSTSMCPWGASSQPNTVSGRSTVTPGVLAGTTIMDCCSWRPASGLVLPMTI